MKQTGNTYGTKVVPCHKQLNNVISMQLLTKNMYKEMNYNKLGCSKVRYVREQLNK